MLRKHSANFREEIAPQVFLSIKRSINNGMKHFTRKNGNTGIDGNRDCDKIAGLNIIV
jgi:hypothetical protein